MAHADLAVLWGVGMLAIACLFVCAVHLYRSSDTHRLRVKVRNRKRRAAAANRPESVAAHAALRAHVPRCDSGAVTGTQLSPRCKGALFRAVFDHHYNDSIVFLMAANRDDARERASGALAVIHDIAVQDIRLANVASFQDMIEAGVSEDRDLRVFELAWKGSHVSEWAAHPLFLTDDSTLLGKWAELYADTAREVALSAIDRARS